jgi:putative spermidine/putrescine transport system ATP-binding protein
VVLRGIRKAFGRTLAVDGLDLAVPPGEFVALLGPSGCGKTTTLRIVASFERPDTGEVLIQGSRAIDKPPHRRDVGIVFQSYALFPHMTVLENVSYGLRMRRVPAVGRASRVAAALEMVRLRGLEDRYPRELSGGQQQRVAVARAIVIRPSVLLLDEPLSNLDARLRQTMREELRDLQRTLRIDTILVTHDQDRGAESRRPGRGDAGGARRAGRVAGGDLRAPGVAVRGRVHGPL